MIFPTPLLSGRLIQRYKRFLADIELDNGLKITAHCANSGALMGVCQPGNRVWVSQTDAPNRKLPYTWEMVMDSDAIVGVNTRWPNILVRDALIRRTIKPLQDYHTIRAEVPYGTRSRIDFFLQQEGLQDCYVEVKNVHLKRTENTAEFPDGITARGTKHLNELQEQVRLGNRAVMIYIVQRNDCQYFQLAADLDPLYAETARISFAAGVEAYAYACDVSPESIKIERELMIQS